MMRVRAVVSIALESAGLGALPGGGGDPVAEGRDRLERAARRAFAMALLATGALVVLLVSRSALGPFLAFGDGDTPFSLAALAVAFFAGFRLAQGLRYRAARRVVEELPEEG